MKERGMLFAGDMVRAILDGSKTQTRRPMRPQPALGASHGLWWLRPETRSWMDLAFARFYAPHGKPGDVIYVRETWGRGFTYAGKYSCVFYRADDGCRLINGDTTVATSQPSRPPHSMKWTPSIHMPRWASRIDLPIVDVRVERIQDISTTSIMREGFRTKMREHDAKIDLEEQFIRTWEATYPGSWERNDWVWVYEWNQIKVKP